MSLAGELLRKLLRDSRDAECSSLLKLFDDFQVGIALFDLDHSYRYVNQAALAVAPEVLCDALGERVDEVVARHFPAEVVARVQDIFAAVRASGEPYHKQAWDVRQLHIVQQQRWVEWWLHRLEDADGVPIGLMLTMTDVSEHVRARRSMERKNLELAESRTELEHFANALAHDMQEPLRAVILHLELLERFAGTDLDPRALHSLRRAVDNSRRMRRLIAGMLDYARSTDPTPVIEEVSAREALDVALELLDEAIKGAGAEIVVGDLPTLCCNPQRLVLLFQNLISNALRYGGEAVRVEVAGARVGADWLISVSDNGPGVPQEQRNGIFRPFTRSQAGSGLGLSLCRRILESGGGQIWVDDAPGGGARFNCSFPVDAERRVDRHPTPPPGSMREAIFTE